MLLFMDEFRAVFRVYNFNFGFYVKGSNLVKIWDSFNRGFGALSITTVHSLYERLSHSVVRTVMFSWSKVSNRFPKHCVLGENQATCEVFCPIILCRVHLPKPKAPRVVIGADAAA